jgi:hypothetical protein
VDDSELDARMRDVLLQLALISQGRTASYNSSGGSEVDYTPITFNAAGDVVPISRDQAPHEHFARLYDAAESDDARQRVCDQAAKLLDDIRRSSGDPGRAETRQQLFARIVAAGEGWPAQDVANRMRCGVTLVRKAREEAGRETETGQLLRNGRELTPEQRQAEIERLMADGLSARQVARALRLSYSTVLRALGAKD